VENLVPDLLIPYAPFLVAALVALGLTPVAMRIARAVGAVAHPKADRWHARETPLLGGIAITAGILAGLLFSDVPDTQLLAVAAGVILLFATGLIDDLSGLRPVTKLVAQTAAAGILVVGGVEAGWPEMRLVTIPLTIFWVVGITNALNLLDNMDGLAAGVTAISGLAVAACAAQVEGGVGLPAALMALSVSGAALGFLPWNAHPARVFMGDAGSLPLGFALAASSLMATHREAGHLALVLAAPLLALAVPILDTTLVSVVRKAHGRAISQGGRDHLSHRLVALGIPEQRAVQLLWLLSAVLGAFAVATTRLDFLGTFVFLAIGLVASTVLGVVVGRVKVYAPTERADEAERTEELRRTFLNYARILGPFATDFMLAGAAYVGAYLLRYEGEIPGPDRALLEQSIAVVVVVQLAALTACRVYRSVWRYFGIQDAANLARGIGTAAVVSTIVVVFFWRESVFSRAVFVTDAVLLAVLLFGVRALTRFVNDAFGGFDHGGERVLVVGAGEAGTLCLRALRARGGEPVSPIGILDDDPGLRRRQIHGVPVVGQVGDLEDVLSALDPEEVVLSSLPEDEQLEVMREIVGRSGARLTLSPYAKAFVPL
jgi:UDP-GlcNAc:undecaprenyl-phosphate GlcNAc-1-phosphate transferase